MQLLSISFFVLFMKATCPVCGAQFTVENDVEIDEVIVCPECGSRLVVEGIRDGKVILKEAPAVEEDWGE
jgi:lysine biosynthesis protein LysW